MQLGFRRTHGRNFRDECRQILDGSVLKEAYPNGFSCEGGRIERRNEFGIGNRRSENDDRFFGPSDERKDFLSRVERGDVKSRRDRGSERRSPKVALEDEAKEFGGFGVIPENEKFPVFRKRGFRVVSRRKNVVPTVRDGVFGMGIGEGVAT